MEKQTNKVNHSKVSLPGVISIIAIVYFLFYLWWRATYTLNPAYPVFSWVLWAAEAFGVFAYILFAYITKNITPIRSFVPPPTGVNVDVFVPTYNEPEEILEATLVGCSKIAYPHTTYLLDDGNRAEVKRLAERLGANYIARPTHEFAKAGNINYALQQSSGQFIIILDADMVPQPNFIERTLGYFDDDELALIQLPQEFYNKDSIQHADESSTWHEQSLFFRVIQPGKNYTNSAFWCGSPSMVRRSALASVNGVATETITEDIHTTVRLHSLGWKTLYINEPLAFGIAPQTIQSFLLQRLRWAQGTMQLYSSKECPLWIKGLTLRQRLSYFSSFLAYLEAFQKLVLLLIPVMILAFDAFPMRVKIDVFLMVWIPFFLLNYFANQVGGRGYFNYFKTEKYNLLKMMIFIQSTLTLFVRKPLKFKVTPKTVDNSVYQKERHSLRLYIVLFGLLVVSMLYAVVKVTFLHDERIAVDALLIAFFWAGYNSTIIVMALHEIFTKRHERLQYRFKVDLKGWICSDCKQNIATPVKITDLSTGGCRFVFDGEVPEVRDWQLRVSLPGSGEVMLPVAMLTFKKKLADGKSEAGCRFGELSVETRDALFAYLFILLPPQKISGDYTAPIWQPLRQVANFFRRLGGSLTGNV